MALLGGCKPEAENIYNMFDEVHVTFHGDHPLSVTDYKLVNDGDSAYVDYTISSDNEDMYSIVEERVGTANGSEARLEMQIGEQFRRSYTGRIKLKMERDGKNSFRVFARDRVGTYMGDGYKKVTIEGAPSFMVYQTRRVFAPDTLDKVRPAFFSLATGESFSYTDGSQHTDKIDLGIWRRVLINEQTKVQTITYNYYSLTAPSIPWTIYDISGWTNKRATQFSNPVKGATNIFIQQLSSGSIIETRAKAAGLAVRATNYSATADGLAAGNVVYFLTPEGKYGAMLVNQVTEDLDKRPYLSVSVKIQN